MEPNKYIEAIKKEGYTIEYLIKDNIYSADVYYPWNKKDYLHYAQQGIEGFYKNLYEFVINKK